MKRLALLLSLFVLLPASPALARSASAAPAPARVVHAVRFPADTAMHPDAGVEWWYFVGHLADKAGHQYGFETTFFKFSGLRRYFPGSPADVAYRTDVAITDEAAKKFHHAITYDAPALHQGAIASTTRLQLKAGLISVQTLGPLSYAVHGAMPDGRVDLTVTSRRAPMLEHGGYLGWGSGYTYYYSLTHMDAVGTLTIKGRRIAVHGVAWHDHQWGDMGGTSVKGWDWMALQLSDGTDMDLVNERPASFEYAKWAQALLPDNTQRYVRGNVTITPLAYWRSPISKVTYPSAWRVRVPSLGLDVTVRPTIHPQEMIDSYGLLGYKQSYWEGSCTVTGTRNGRPITGKAYTELTGYDSFSLSQP